MELNKYHARPRTEEEEALIDEVFLREISNFPEDEFGIKMKRTSIEVLALRYYYKRASNKNHESDDDIMIFMEECKKDFLNPELSKEDLFDKYFKKGVHEKNRKKLFEILAVIKEAA
jgi:hypothetical protein